MKTILKSTAGRVLAYLLCWCLGIEPVHAALVTLSSTPLATAGGGSSVLPNLMFTLDSSGSMDSDFLPDYVDDARQCMLVDNPPSGVSSTACRTGDPARQAGGPKGYNGVGYDPQFNYRPGVKVDGTNYLASISVTSVPNDAYGVQSTSNTNITTGITDLRYCNTTGSGAVCKRNGADNAGTTLVGGADSYGNTHPAGRFPYRTHRENTSTQIFGLPETMAMGSFTRSGSTVTATTLAPHGLTSSDRVYVTTGNGGLDRTCVPVTATPAPSGTTFTYTSSGSGNISATTGSFRKCVTGTFVRNNLLPLSALFVGSPTSLTRVTSVGHGLVTGDILTTANASTSSLNQSSAVITVLDADNFTFDTSSSTAQNQSAQWVRTGLYNTRSSTTGPALAYTIVPVEYCTDSNLTDCVEVIPGNTPPVGYSFPAYVRFCQTQEQALAPGGIGDASSTNARCRGKFVDSSAVSTKWRNARYGWFARENIVTGVTFGGRPTRSDCAAAPDCTYTEEINNYARWFTYYHTRMQMMKTASGRAFLPFVSNPTASPVIPNKLRVGFITINPFYDTSNNQQSSVQSARYLKISEFTVAHATNWYSKFYAQDPNQSTPLREALARVGWIFAGKLNTGLTSGIPNADDPMLASCQRNFTLLTTDGYWNGNNGKDLANAATGNADNLNPTVDTPYTAPSVDRTTTGTFDGGKDTTVRTLTPTVQLQQAACIQNSTTAFGGGGTETSCGCATGEHRIKQRTATTTQTVETLDGVETQNTPGTPVYTFQDITACLPAAVNSTTTVTTNLQQQVCTGNINTTFGAGAQQACGCTGLQKRVKQQTRAKADVLTTVDGVTTVNTTGSFSDSFQNITAVCDAQVRTVVTHTVVVDEQVVNGTSTSTFSAINGVGTGANQAGTTCAAGTGRIKRRTTNYDTTVVTTDGVAAAPTFSNQTYGFTNVGSCVALATNTQIFSVIEVAEDIGGEGSNINTTFTAAQNGSNPQLNYSCSGSGTRTQKFTRTVRYNKTVTTVTGAAPVTTFSGLTNAPATPTTVGSCDTSGKSTATTTVTPTLTSNNNTNGPDPVAAAQTVTPTPVSDNTVGSTVAVDPTFTPNPQSSVVPTTVSTAGTPVSVALSPNPSAPAIGTPTVTITPGGFPDTLADVAMYYYRTDLRGGTDFKGHATGPSTNLGGTGTIDVATNNVPAKSGARNFATHQNMVTFSVGMVDGLMRYQSDYDTASSGDFSAIRAGTSGGCYWNGTGVCNWPEPFQDDPTALDDLWHAAVNGRGQYYLASNVDSLAAGLQNTLTALNAQVAAAAASATSSPNVTQTDNQIFSTTYETNTWAGRVFAQTIDPSTGNVGSAIQWQADALLLSKVAASSDTRVMKTFDTATNTIKDFLWSSLTSTERGFFASKCGSGTLLSQCGSSGGLSTAQKDAIDVGDIMVSFLRGQTGNEVTLFRDRTFIDPATNGVVQTVLGDTISAKPSYVRAPTFNYSENGYSDAVTGFRASKSTRRPRVFVGANDGFLHAFDGDTGVEAWAYTPRFLMPALYRLADKLYATQHQYFVDGSPETADVYDVNDPTPQWKTILVGGAAGGGRGFYALDITDENNPKALWEFCSDATLCNISRSDLGLSYGNPVIGKRRSDGKWVVVLTSGLNNATPGSGEGKFFVLDAITGAVLSEVGTGVGSIATPAGLMKISAFFDSAITDATFQYVYGGDQLGNVWRLDVGPATPVVTKLTTLMDSTGVGARAQPITTRPALTHIGTDRVLYIGTGRYLGTPDLTDAGAGAPSWQQTLYAFKDKVFGAAAGLNNLRDDAANLVVRTLTQISPTERGISTTPTVTMDWASKDGWYLDFNPSFASVQNSPGEGVNLVDPRLILGTLAVTTNVPAAGTASCAAGGSSFFYNFDFKTGLPISTSPNGVVGVSLGGSITVGVAIVQLPSGAIKSISTGADTSKTTSNVNTSTTGLGVKRFSYRLR